MDYKNAGVDIEAGYKAVELMKKHIASTMRDEVLTDIGGFSGAFSIISPILVSLFITIFLFLLIFILKYYIR